MANQISAEQQQELVNGISQALQQGVSPQQILQTLVKMGIPQEQAVGVLQQIMQQMQGGADQMDQQTQATMRYGGIPRAAYGMQASPQFGTGMIQTMPNVRSFPSYNAYKTAYDQYIDQLGSALQTTIPDLSADMGMDGGDQGQPLDVITEEEYNKLIQDNPELANSIPKPVAKDDSAKAAEISTAIENLEPEQTVQEKIKNLQGGDAANQTSPWWYVLGTAAGIGGAGLGAYGGYKGYKALKRRYGKVGEVDLANLTPREREAFMKTVDAVKARIVEQGYYTNKDINDLVANGVPRKEAEDFVANMLTKKEKKAANKKANAPSATPAPDNSANVAAAKQASIDNAKTEVASWAENSSNILNNPTFTDADKAAAKEYFDDPIAFFKKKLAANPTDQLYLDALAHHEMAAQEGFLPTYVAPTTPIGPTYPAGYRATPTVVSPTQLGQLKESIKAKKSGVGSTVLTDAQKIINANKAARKINVETYKPEVGTNPKTPRDKRKFERQKVRGRKVVLPEEIKDILSGGKMKGEVKIDYGKMRRNPEIKLKHGGEPGYSDTYSAGVYYGAGGYVPEYAASAYGVQDLPQFRMGSYYDDDTYPYIPSQEELAAAQMMYGNPFAPSPLSKFVYPQSYADGGAAMGMSPEEQQMMMMQQQGAQQEMPQQAQGGQEQQIIQAVAQMLQQGVQPEQIMQQLVQAGVPQEMAMQVIQMVMQQMQGGGGQEQMAPQQPPVPMQKYGGSKKRNSMVGREMDVTPQQMEELRRKGVKFEII